MDNWEFDAAFRDENISLLAGVDEAGRGPLCGPVYAAAVILTPERPISGLRDSKKLSEAKREQLFEEITQKAVAYGIGSASVEEIEAVNILQATYLAMCRAVSALSVQPQLVIIDGNRTPPQLTIPSQTVVKGDALSASIAAASILAKVSRDRLLEEWDVLYPGYGFAKHKGYGTAAHYEALKQLGPSPVHRMSFLKKLYPEQKG